MGNRTGWLNDVLADDCCVPSCQKPAHEDMPVPMCAGHAIRVYGHMQAYIAGLDPTPVDDEQDILTRYEEARDARRAARADRSLVYYLRLGKYIKIGHTASMRTRLSGLRAFPGDLLATEAGAHELEQARHHQFAHLRVGRREDFRPEPDLMAHIDSVLREWGRPKLDGVPTRIPA